MSSRLLNWIDRSAFWITIAAGGLAAVAGGAGYSKTAIVAGCIAAATPIVNRIASSRQHKNFVDLLGPRSLSDRQRKVLIAELSKGAPFALWIAHNRHEAEPIQFHKQITEALKMAGLETKYFGGMNNNTIGIEISGPQSPEKERLIHALSIAGIPFVSIEFTDHAGQQWGLAIWIGSNPGAASGRP